MYPVCYETDTHGKVICCVLMELSLAKEGKLQTFTYGHIRTREW